MNPAEKITAKLNEIQLKLKAPKGQFNNFGKYKYRSCEDILEAIKPLLSGVALVITDDIVERGSGEITEVRYYVKATVTLTDGNESISVSAFAREPLSKKGMDESQITGTASSYARKYALNGLFCIDDTKDADTMDNSNTSPQQKAPAAKKFLTVKDVQDEKFQKSLSKRTDFMDAMAAIEKVYAVPIPTDAVQEINKHFNAREQ